MRSMKSKSGAAKGQKKIAKPKAAKQKQKPLPARKQVDLVTGGASGIGVRLVSKLLERGDEVRVLIYIRPGVSSMDILQRLPRGIIPYKTDITLSQPENKKVLDDACTGVDNVFHLAAVTDLDDTATYDRFINVNVVGTENVLRACIDSNPPEHQIRFIYLSSISVYGNKRRGEILTEDSETRPSSGYGETKLMAERVVQSFGDAHANLRYTILRAANMYGPNYVRSFNKVFKHIKEQHLPYVGKGDNHITLVHVDDVSKAIIMSLDNQTSVGKIYIVSDGQPYTLRQLFDRAATDLNVPPPQKSVPSVLAKLGAKRLNIGRAELEYLLSDRLLSIDKIKRELNFIPEHNIDTESKKLTEEFLKSYVPKHMEK